MFKMNVNNLIESKRDENGRYRSFMFEELLQVGGQDLMVLLPHIFFAKGDPPLQKITPDEVIHLVSVWIEGVNEDSVNYITHLLSPKLLPNRCKGEAVLLLDKISNLGFSVFVQEEVGKIRELWLA